MNTNPPHKITRILSLGAGVQSSTLALMAATGETEHRLDAAIFADTQAEPASVYRWLDWLEAEIQRSPYPYPVHRVTKGNLASDSLRVRTSKKTGMTYMKHSIPAFMLRANGKGGIMGRACTLDHKITPILRAAKQIAGVKLRQKHATVEMWIGISTDEAIRMKPARLPWIYNVWPLIDAGVSRTGCAAWMSARGFPQPPRSSCSFCPYHSDKEWARLKTEEPEAFADAVAYEADLQRAIAQCPRLDGVPYLHNSRQPLHTIDFTANANGNHPDMFGNECEGLCGV